MRGLLRVEIAGARSERVMRQGFRRPLMTRGAIQMARKETEIRLPQREEGVPLPTAGSAEPSLGELFKRLSSDTGELIRQEVSLAKVELKEASATLARDAAKVGVAVGFALAGVLAVTAFAIVGLGDLFGNYWVAALIVGVLLLATGGYLARSAINDVKTRGLKPHETVATLRDDAAWVKEEGRELKRELTR